MVGLFRMRLDNGLIGEGEAVFLECGHNLVSDRHQAQARGFELRGLCVECKAVAARGAGRPSVSSARSIASWLEEAPEGSHTAPAEIVADTMPARVSTTSSRTMARKRSATSAISRSLQLPRMTPSLLPAMRPMMSLPRSERAMRSPDGHDHFVGGVKAIGSLIIASRSIEATRKAQVRFSARRFNGLCEFFAQRVAIEMSRQLVARGQVGQALRIARFSSVMTLTVPVRRSARPVRRHAHAAHMNQTEPIADAASKSRSKVLSPALAVSMMAASFWRPSDSSSREMPRPV